MRQDKIDTTELLDTIRGLSEGDEITVTFGAVAVEDVRRKFRVERSVGLKRPLIDLDPRFDTDDDGGVIGLEFDKHYSDGTPYNLRWPASDYDGRSVSHILVE